MIFYYYVKNVTSGMLTGFGFELDSVPENKKVKIN